MADWVCQGCGCRFAVGAPCCPECQATSAIENGDLGGPDVYADAPAVVDVAPEVEPEPAVPVPRGKTTTTS